MLTARSPFLADRLYWVRVADDVGLTAEERNHSLWPDCRPCMPMCSLSVYDTDYDTFPSAYVFSKMQTTPSSSKFYLCL